MACTLAHMRCCVYLPAHVSHDMYAACTATVPLQATVAGSGVSLLLLLPLLVLELCPGCSMVCLPLKLRAGQGVLHAQ